MQTFDCIGCDRISRNSTGGESFGRIREEKDMRRNNRERDRTWKVMENRCKTFATPFVRASVCNQPKQLTDHRLPRPGVSCCA